MSLKNFLTFVVALIAVVAIVFDRMDVARSAPPGIAASDAPLAASPLPAALAPASPAPAPATVAPTMPSATQAPVKIMLLGDSITAGIDAGGTPDARGGYRSRLVFLLQAAGYHFVMVGSRTDYSGALTQPEHEGWPGYVLRSFPSKPAGELYGPVVHDAILNYHPDIILLMAGTNDLLRHEKDYAGYTIDNIVESMNLVLAQIFTLDPQVRVILAGVVDSPKVSQCSVLDFDLGSSSCDSSTESLAGLVKHYSERGYHISLADGMDQAVPRDLEHFPDGIHPSGTGGYDAIADVWFRSLAQILPKPEVAAAPTR